MKVNGRHTRSIWVEPDGETVAVIDQTVLPHRFATIRLATLDDAARAIKSMQVRGAPLIGATAAYGLCLALKADASDESLERAYAVLFATRPTAINLKWALDEMMAAVRNRPRNQGASLTAWELGRHGVPHTVIPDNTGGHLMQHGLVDMAIVGTDRVTANGDVCNKIGTYLKALAAKDNRVPFYVALPSPT